MNNPRIIVEVGESNRAAIFCRNLQPYDSIRLLLSTALALLDGKADVVFNEGPPLTEEEEEEILQSLVEGAPGGSSRDN